MQFSMDWDYCEGEFYIFHKGFLTILLVLGHIMGKQRYRLNRMEEEL